MLSDIALYSHPECEALSDPDNGHVTLTGTSLNSQATYTCNSGYELNGPMTRACQTNGWSGNDTTCEGKESHKQSYDHYTSIIIQTFK